ncbi:MAG TPA: molybdate ABC transporter substrate-binding protein [Terriglobales bacterium]
MKPFLLCALLFVLLALPVVAQAEEITVAAASDLSFVFGEIATRFQQETGNSVKLSFGSSGNFYSQIQNGAPYDIFFSADVEYPKKLEEAGLIEPGTLYEYASGKLVLWAPNDSKIDVQQGLKCLLDPRVRKIAIANPAHAPYGRAAEAALKKAGLYDKVSSRLVLGENISQTAHFVETGNAEVGLIALSLALAPEMKGRGTYYLVPRELYSPIVQGAVILKSSANKKTARRFLEFIKSPAISNLMKQYGFESPESSSPR